MENRTFNNQEQPKPHDFKRHYEELLNIAGESERLESFQYDDAQSNQETDKEIEYVEVEDAIAMKDNSSGPDNVAPGLLKYLPIQWIFFILNLLNFILLSGRFPID